MNKENFVERILSKIVGEEIKDDELEMVAGARPCEGYITKNADGSTNCDMQA